MRIFSIAMIAVAGALCGCFGPRLAKSPDLPQTEGKVRFHRTRDAQTRIDLKLKHLAQPEELTPPGYLYVAWVRGDKEALPQKVGSLEMDKDLKGELSALTPLNRFDLFVTAESSPEIENPTGLPLLWARREP